MDPQIERSNAATTEPYAVSVRELCAFTSKSGDLDRRFTPSPTAMEGMAGHKAVAARRPPHHVSELTLNGSFNGLMVRGRADGYDPIQARLEEVKTYRSSLDRVPDNHRQLHRAQAETYAHLQCAKTGLTTLEVAVVYVDVATHIETAFPRTMSAGSLEALFIDRCRRFSEWAVQETAHRVARDQSLVEMGFPHSAFHGGQRELAEAVYRGAREGKCVLAQAPTGIGKTVGTLFPALKALATEKLDKIFFLTAKTSGKQGALDAMAQLSLRSVVPPRVIELAARDTACEHPDRDCHGESCPLARGFYDRLADARSAAVATPVLDRARVRAIALEHGVCPYYLGQELVKWCDVVIGDYNHYFDASAMLHGMTVADDWRVVVLVDEAHNLVERGRAMYTAELLRSDLRAAARKAPSPVKRALQRLDRCWKQLADSSTSDYQVHEAVPSTWARALDSTTSAIGVLQTEQPEAIDSALLQLFFDLGNFGRLVESFGDHSIVDGTRVRSTKGLDDHRLCVRNVMPGAFLAPRLAAARSVSLFSATLAPSAFYRHMLSLPQGTVEIDVVSPFSAEQLDVHIAGGISTRFADRARSIVPIADLIARGYEAAPGNYIAFFSSFDYLEQVATQVARSHPALTIWQQGRRMTSAEQNQFVDRFELDGRGIGFAVLGGRFAEGIDLPGRRLVGAFIATLGMPQVNPVSEQMRRHMQRQFGSGYEFTYLYPGMRKVAQAAGRVIRSTTDRGVVYLIDDRFKSEVVRQLMPQWWTPRIL